MRHIHFRIWCKHGNGGQVGCGHKPGKNMAAKTVPCSEVDCRVWKQQQERRQLGKLV